MSHNPTHSAMQDLLDKEKIRQNLVLYCRGMDRQDLETMRATYWPEAWEDHGLFQGSGYDFCDFVVSTWPLMRVFHLLGQAFIEVENGTANSEAYFIAHHRISPSGHSNDMILGGRYLDRLEKRGEVWKLIHRIVAHDWWRDEGSSPSSSVGIWNNLPLNVRNCGSTIDDYSWELFSHRSSSKQDKSIKVGRSSCSQAA